MEIRKNHQSLFPNAQSGVFKASGMAAKAFSSNADDAAAGQGGQPLSQDDMPVVVDFDEVEREQQQSAPMFNVFSQNNSLVGRVGANQPAVVDDFDHEDQGLDESEEESVEAATP